MIAPTSPENRPSSFALDKRHVGEATEREAYAIESQCQNDVVQAQLQERRERFAELEARPEFAAFLDREFNRHQTNTAPDANKTTQPWWQTWLDWQAWTAMATACAAALFFVFLPPKASDLLHQPNRTELGTTQPNALAAKSKGGCKGSCLNTSGNSTMFRVLYFRKGAPYPKWLRQRQTLHPGDLIQFSLRVSQKSTHVMIVGMNQRGEQYAFVPYQGKQSLAVSNGTLKLPHSSSLELDDYLGPERFYFFAAKAPFSLADVKRAMRKAFVQKGKSLAALKSIPGPWHSSSLLIIKRKR